MNLYKREIYKKSLQHAERRNHKYLYKIGDRYIYPEDVAGKAKSSASNIGSMATAAGTAAKTKISNTIADQKTKLKDKKYLLDEKRRKYPNLEKANVTSPGGKRVNQITSAHQEGTKKTTALSYQSTHDPISNKVVKVKRDFDANGDQIGVGYSTEPSHLAKKKQRNKIDQQRKSAHAGYEADKKAFPEGGSTEELELQKKKTAARKTGKSIERNNREKEAARKRKIANNVAITNAHQRATSTANQENYEFGKKVFRTGGSRGATGYNYRITDGELAAKARRARRARRSKLNTKKARK